jgi:dihydroorotate dehydrogenase electron transfer subunit
MKEEKCVVVENKHIRKHYYLMKLESSYIAGQAKAGNFVMVAVSKSFEPLLKRPFGILDVQPPKIRLYYEIVGKGTEMMADLKPGDRVNVVGPLGNAFPELENKNILVVGGGRGIAPLFYAMGRYTANNNVFLIYGAKSSEDMNLLEEIEQLPLKRTFLYTDDGSKGKKGFVTSDISEIIAENAIDVTISCGPEAMFENLYHTINDIGTENYVSMEAMMGCGFGICYSCAVKTVDGDYKKTCIDGPVFKMEAIAWEE